VLGLDSRIVKLESSQDGETAQITDRLAWDWYAESCSCGLPAGGCRAHPRGRPSQRPPSGDWRVWAMDALRGGIRDALPDGSVPARDFARVHVSRLF